METNNEIAALEARLAFIKEQRATLSWEAGNISTHDQLAKEEAEVFAALTWKQMGF